MAKEVEKRFKYSFHLATIGVKNFEDFLTPAAKENSKIVPSRTSLPFICELRVVTLPFSPPGWARKLDDFFALDGAVKTAGAGGALMLKSGTRILACTYGYGHTLLDTDKRESDFGLLVAANSLSEENVKLVEKANLGSVIRDATQAAGITRLQEFDVDRALSLVRKLSGRDKDGKSSVSGSSSVTVTSKFDVNELHNVASALVKLYADKSYQDTAFVIIDKIRPVLDTQLISELDQIMLDSVNSENPAFELGSPEIATEPIGFMTMPGSGKRVRVPDVSLSFYKEVVGTFETIDDLIKCRVASYDIDGKHKISEWSIYRGLVGSIHYGSERYAINEGRWYRVADALVESANSAFGAASVGLDTNFLPWPVVGGGKNKKTPTYEPEEDYNRRIADGGGGRFLLMDKKLVPVPNMPGPGIEICDLLDIEERRLIHIKKSGRRSSVISHFLMQGWNSAKLTRLYDAVREGLNSHIVAEIGQDTADSLLADFPGNWTIEYKFGDRPIGASQEYTIPFFSRVTLDDVKREIEALGFKKVEISFIRLSKPPDKI